MAKKNEPYIPEGIKMLIIITGENLSFKLIPLLNQYGVRYCNTVKGKGTANQEVLDFLGIGETEKDLIFCLADEKVIPDVLTFLKENGEFVGGRKGIAFTISLDSVASLKAIKEIVGSN